MRIKHNKLNTTIVLDFKLVDVDNLCVEFVVNMYVINSVKYILFEFNKSDSIRSFICRYLGIKDNEISYKSIFGIMDRSMCRKLRDDILYTIMSVKKLVEEMIDENEYSRCK